MEEGGNIIRNIFGKSYKEAESITKDASKGALDFKSPKENTFYGKEGGKKFADYEVKKQEEEPQKGFSGWWSPDYEGMRNLERDSLNPKAYLDETVYFQLNVSDRIPVGTSITFQLWDKDAPYVPLFNDVKFDDKRVYRTAIVREVNGQRRITIELYLNPKWHNDVIQDKKGSFDACLEFYWTWKYLNQYWNSSNNVLDVYASKTTLFIKPAYEGYGFSEIRSSDGDIVVFSKGIGLQSEPTKELESQLNTIADNIKDELYGDVLGAIKKYSDNIRQTIAVRQLKRGHLANNMGKIEFSRKIYTKPVYDNSGELYEIRKAGNFGYRKNGNVVTTKGISQLDYFREVGTFNAIAKASKELLGIFDFASDVISLGMDENPKTIMTGFAPLDFVVAMVSPSITESIIETWDNVVYELAEKAKDKGIRGINDFIITNAGKESRYGYNILEINQIVLDTLLKGKIQKIEDLQNLQRENNNLSSSASYMLFYYKQKQKDRDEEVTILDCIFINL